MNVSEVTRISGALLFRPTPHVDERGFFSRTFDAEVARQAGIDPAGFAQDSLSRSVRGVVRGLHVRRGAGEAKLVRCSYGGIFDVIGRPITEFMAPDSDEQDRARRWLDVLASSRFAERDGFDDVEYRAVRAPDELRLAVPAPHVQAAHHTADRAGEAILGEGGVDAGRAHDLRIEGAGEEAALVHVRGGPEQQSP